MVPALRMVHHAPEKDVTLLSSTAIAQRRVSFTRRARYSACWYAHSHRLSMPSHTVSCLSTCLPPTAIYMIHSLPASPGA